MNTITLKWTWYNYEINCHLYLLQSSFREQLFPYDLITMPQDYITLNIVLILCTCLFSKTALYLALKNWINPVTFQAVSGGVSCLWLRAASQSCPAFMSADDKLNWGCGSCCLQSRCDIHGTWMINACNWAKLVHNGPMFNFRSMAGQENEKLVHWGLSLTWSFGSKKHQHVANGTVLTV